MANKFQNKYRIPSVRAQWWDYGDNAAYFITICIKNKTEYFGEIKNQEMQLSILGEIAHQIYLDIPKQFPFIILDEFIAMPDHLHAIIIIDKPPVHPRLIADQPDSRLIADQPDNRLIADQPDNRLIADQPDNRLIADQSDNRLIADQKEKKGGITGIKNPMLHENLSRVIRWYKGRTTFECRKIHTDFAWQSLFYDHIIRDENSYQRIKQYIIDNPKNWKLKK